MFNHNLDEVDWCKPLKTDLIEQDPPKIASVQVINLIEVLGNVFNRALIQENSAVAFVVGIDKACQYLI